MNYSLLEYLESSGEQYIDTGVGVTTDTMIEVELAVLECDVGETEEHITAQDYNLVGSYGNKTGLALGIYSGKFRFWNKAPQTQVFEYVKGQKYKIVLNNNEKYTVDGVEQTLTSTEIIEQPNTIYLFSAQYNGEPGSPKKPGAVRIYGVKIYKGENLVRNFIPCYSRIEEEKGMYDLVNKRFYKNLTTTPFI